MTRTCGNCRGYVDGRCQPAQDCCVGSSVSPHDEACGHWDARTHGNCKYYKRIPMRPSCSPPQEVGDGRCYRDDGPVLADGDACKRWVGR
jgi:hypothetical protein